MALFIPLAIGDIEASPGDHESHLEACCRVGGMPLNPPYVSFGRFSGTNLLEH